MLWSKISAPVLPNFNFKSFIMWQEKMWNLFASFDVPMEKEVSPQEVLKAETGIQAVSWFVLLKHLESSSLNLFLTYIDSGVPIRVLIGPWIRWWETDLKSSFYECISQIIKETAEKVTQKVKKQSEKKAARMPEDASCRLIRGLKSEKLRERLHRRVCLWHTVLYATSLQR